MSYEQIRQKVEAHEQSEQTFFQLAERFLAASNPEKVKDLGDRLGRFIFGE